MEEEKEGSEREERVRAIAMSYYSRNDVTSALFNFSKKREVIPRYFDRFGKRPDIFHYPSDIQSFVKKGWVSFHCSEELWKDPLTLSTELSEEEIQELRAGWDLLLDVDSHYLDYSKIATKLLIQALEFHGVKNIGVKFSGKKGFHIIVPWNSFPKELSGVDSSKMFPEWPRKICVYLNELIKDKLVEVISDLMHKDRKSYVKDFEASKQVAPDIVLVSPRHLFRMPYSLHEGTALASIVLNKEDIENFQIQDANPLKVQVKDFYPNPQHEEARELLIQALDWHKSREQTKEENKKETKRGQAFKEITITDLTPNLYPPCIAEILNGVKSDGRKRALFILINFFRSLKLNEEKITTLLEEWNKKNYKPLKEGYISSQISWHLKQKMMLPPNCDKSYYKDLGICKPDTLCKMIKNPVNYSIKKSFSFRKPEQKHGKRKDFK